MGAEMRIGLVWVAVADLDKSIKFYTDVVGLKLEEHNEMFGWAELTGEDGARLGLAKTDDPLPPGSNAVVTLTVDDIEKSKAEMSSNGAKMIGDIMEVPGHVKLQLFTDADGNHFQLAELIS